MSESALLLLLRKRRGIVDHELRLRLLGRRRMQLVVLFLQDGLENDGVAAAGTRRLRLLLQHRMVLLQMWRMLLRLLLLLLSFKRLPSARLILVVRMLVLVL